MSWFSSGRYSPIGIDVGMRSIKLAQLEFGPDGSRVAAIGQQVLPMKAQGAAERSEAIRTALAEQLANGQFRGRDAVLGLNSRQLFIQNVRVPRIAGEELDKVMRWEAEERLPDDFGPAEVRHITAGEVRSGSGESNEARQELILLACRRKEIEELIGMAESVRLRPRAIDIPPCALVRSSTLALRRKSDEQVGLLFIDIGAATSNIILTRGHEILLIKPLPIGGLSIDRMVARKLNMGIEDASLVRRQLADGPNDDGDAELNRAMEEAVRGEIEGLIGELVMCLRYHSVTFRGNRISKALLYGGEATPWLAEILSQKLDMPCEIGDPFLGLQVPDHVRDQLGPRHAYWAIALGLACKLRKAA